MVLIKTLTKVNTRGTAKDMAALAMMPRVSFHPALPVFQGSLFCI